MYLLDGMDRHVEADNAELLNVRDMYQEGDGVWRWCDGMGADKEGKAIGRPPRRQKSKKVPPTRAVDKGPTSSDWTRFAF